VVVREKVESFVFFLLLESDSVLYHSQVITYMKFSRGLQAADDNFLGHGFIVNGKWE